MKICVSLFLLIVLLHCSEGWKQHYKYPPHYKKRSSILLTFLRNVSYNSVLDLGCGIQFLRSLLPLSVNYTGVDQYKHASDTIVADFNRKEFPDVFAEVSFCAGIIGYIKDANWFVDQVISRCEYIVGSHAFNLPKGKSWYVNNFTKEEFITLFTSRGCKLLIFDDTEYSWDKNQRLFAFQTPKSIQKIQGGQGGSKPGSIFGNVEKCKNASKVNGEHILIGISGIAGSGKTSVAVALTQLFNHAEIIQSDHYFLPYSKLNKVFSSGRWIEDYNEISAVNWTQLLHDIDSSPARLIFIDSFMMFGYTPLVQKLHAAVIIHFENNLEDLDMMVRRVVERRFGPQAWNANSHKLKKKSKVNGYVRKTVLDTEEIVWKTAWKPNFRWMWDGSKVMLARELVLNLRAADTLWYNVVKAYEFVKKIVPPTLIV